MACLSDLLHHLSVRLLTRFTLSGCPPESWARATRGAPALTTEPLLTHAQSTAEVTQEGNPNVFFPREGVRCEGRSISVANIIARNSGLRNQLFKNGVAMGRFPYFNILAM